MEEQNNTQLVENSRDKINLEIEKQREDNNHALCCYKEQLKAELLKQDIGFLGRFFGCLDHASKNITAVIIILLIIVVSTMSVVVYIVDKDLDFIKSIWTGIIPIISLALGYLFGNNRQKQ